jgi:hypothetical protein
VHADAWGALGQWGTVMVAGVAAWIAIRQLREMQDTRRRVAQPNVVAFLDHNPIQWNYADFVVKNFGQTPAYSIKLTMPDSLQVAYGHNKSDAELPKLLVPEHIAVLAPGQEWRTFWDSGESRLEQDDKVTDEPVIGDLTYWDHMNHQADAAPPFRNPIWIDPKMFHNMHRVRRNGPTELIVAEIAKVSEALGKHTGDTSGTRFGNSPMDFLRHQRNRRAPED